VIELKHPERRGTIGREPEAERAPHRLLTGTAGITNDAAGASCMSRR
jgi:hypothetical protein